MDRLAGCPYDQRQTQEVEKEVAKTNKGGARPSRSQRKDYGHLPGGQKHDQGNPEVPAQRREKPAPATQERCVFRRHGPPKHIGHRLGKSAGLVTFADPISLSISVNWRRRGAACAVLFVEDTVRRDRSGKRGLDRNSAESERREKRSRTRDRSSG